MHAQWYDDDWNCMGIIASQLHALRDGSAITIRSALADDAADVIAAAKRIFAQTDTVLTQADEFTLSVEDEAKFLAGRAESKHGVFVIAVAHGPEAHATCHGPEGRATQIIGIAGLDPAARRRAMHNVTLGIMVDSAWHRRGVGDALMGTLMAWARANPLLRRVQLEVVATNTHAVRLYERHGFVTEGLRRGVFQRQPGVFEDDLIMAADVSTP